MRQMHHYSFIQGLFERKFPVVLQTESTECGLACVAMIANHFGNPVNLRDLRLKFSVSLKGLSLGALIRVAKRTGLATRAVRTELDGLRHLKLPCILHWKFNHFVVLTKIESDYALIIDPANGEREIAMPPAVGNAGGVGGRRLAP